MGQDKTFDERLTPEIFWKQDQMSVCVLDVHLHSIIVLKNLFTPFSNTTHWVI